MTTTLTYHADRWRSRKRGPRGHVHGSPEAEAWSRRHPPGTTVSYRLQARGQSLVTEVTGLAWTLSTGRVVVALRGVCGCVGIDCVSVIEEQKG